MKFLGLAVSILFILGNLSSFAQEQTSVDSIRSVFAIDDYGFPKGDYYIKVRFLSNDRVQFWTCHRKITTACWDIGPKSEYDAWEISHKLSEKLDEIESRDPSLGFKIGVGAGALGGAAVAPMTHNWVARREGWQGNLPLHSIPNVHSIRPQSSWKSMKGLYRLTWRVSTATVGGAIGYGVGHGVDLIRFFTAERDAARARQFLHFIDPENRPEQGYYKHAGDDILDVIDWLNEFLTEVDETTS